MRWHDRKSTLLNLLTPGQWVVLVHLPVEARQAGSVFRSSVGMLVSYDAKAKVGRTHGVASGASRFATLTVIPSQNHLRQQFEQRVVMFFRPATKFLGEHGFQSLARLIGVERAPSGNRHHI